MFKVAKKLVLQGTRHHYDDDVNRRIAVVNLFAAVGSAITCVLALNALFSHDYPLSYILFCASLLFLLSQRVQVVHRNRKGRMVAVVLLLINLQLLMTLLIITGGNEGTGPLWVYTVPPVTMFFAGFKRGLVTIASFTMLISILLFSPDDALLLTHYSFEFKTRLIFSFLTVSFLSAFYEYSRERSYETISYLSDKYEHQAKYDMLTELLNRRGAQLHLEQEESRLKRNGKAFSIALADIDRFKSINDTLGHEMGDEILKRVSRLFKSRVRTQDLIARWGGEEFLFIFPETDAANAVIVCNQIREILQDTPIVVGGKTQKVTSSFGVSEVNTFISVSDALNKADQALYQAKSNGRNLVCEAPLF